MVPLSQLASHFAQLSQYQNQSECSSLSLLKVDCLVAHSIHLQKQFDGSIEAQVGRSCKLLSHGTVDEFPSQLQGKLFSKLSTEGYMEFIELLNYNFLQLA